MHQDLGPGAFWSKRGRSPFLRGLSVEHQISIRTHSESRAPGRGSAELAGAVQRAARRSIPPGVLLELASSLAAWGATAVQLQAESLRSGMVRDPAGEGGTHRKVFVAAGQKQSADCAASGPWDLSYPAFRFPAERITGSAQFRIRPMPSALDSKQVQTVLSRIATEGDAYDGAAKAQVRKRLIETPEPLTLWERAELYADAPIAVSPEVGELLYRLAVSTQARRIIEFGTSLGVSTIYLAAALRDRSSGLIVTTEMHDGKAKRAIEN